MIKRLLVILVVSMFLAFIFAVGTFATVDKSKLGIRSTSADAPAPENAMPSFSKYAPPGGGAKYSALCTNVNPESPLNLLETSQIGDTWYDFQKNGSIGRMIAVTADGYREDSWTYCTGIYPGVGRYVNANYESPARFWKGAYSVDGGVPLNSGYCNQSYLDNGGADDGASVIIFHRTGAAPSKPIWYTTLAVDDEKNGEFFTRMFDVPDFVVGSAYHSEWPKVAVKYDATAGKDYIHVVGTEGNTAGGVPTKVTYVRCYIKDGPGLLDTLISQTYVGTANTYKNVAGTYNSSSYAPVAVFDSSCSITIVPVCSPVSKRVAVVWLRPVDCNLAVNHCNYLSDPCFIESMNSGQDWVDGTNWPPVEYNITNYGCSGTERGANDLNACYDYQDSLHVIYVTAGFDSTLPSSYYTSQARLYHWSKKSGISMITSKIQPGNAPGAHNINIAKMSISALELSYHPLDSIYLYATWTQFDSSDVSHHKFSNGDIYGSGSNTGGYTWGNTYNLTQTHTPDCAAGACLSEHWSSLAQRMYNKELHIQYVCDKDAGGAIQDTPSEWMSNPMMYLNVAAWDIPLVPRGSYQIVSPASWSGPPLKVTPLGNRVLTFKVNSIGNMDLNYSVSSDNNCIDCNFGPFVLAPQHNDQLTAIVKGDGLCNGTLISGNIHISMNDPNNSDVFIPIQAVVATDYYECPRDAATNDTLNNGKTAFYITANSQEWMHDISTRPDTVTADAPGGYEIFFQGGPFVATTVGNDTLVGRYYGANDEHIVAREVLHLNNLDGVGAPLYPNFELEYSWMENIHKFGPPVDSAWWWWELSHENVYFKSNASDDLKRTVIKFVTIERKDAPGWWPSKPTFSGYENTYLGYFMDIDCPYDTNAGQSARNHAGYDATNNIAWQRGSSNAAHDSTYHPAYETYYCGMALIQGSQIGESAVPYGTYNLCNDEWLYPNSGWGWLEQQFYDLAKINTVGTVEFGLEDSIKDRSQMITARMIPAGNNVNAKASFTMVETYSAASLAELQARVAAARAWVAGKPFILCGDVNNSGSVEVGDVVTLINYLFKGYPASVVVEPKKRADCNSSLGVNNGIEVGDIVTLINYLFKGYPATTVKCPGIW